MSTCRARRWPGSWACETYRARRVQSRADAARQRQSADDGARRRGAAASRSSTAMSTSSAGTPGGYVLDRWPLELCDTTDPRKFMLHGDGWKVMALTSPVVAAPGRTQPRRARARRDPLRQGDRARGRLAMLRDRGCADQPGRRRLSDDHLLGQPRAAFDHALQLGQRARLARSRASCSTTRTRTC